MSSAASSANSSPVHRPRRSSGNQNGIKSVMESMATDGDSSFYEYSQIFAGPLGSCQYEVKSLKSATEYAFRLQVYRSSAVLIETNLINSNVFAL